MTNPQGQFLDLYRAGLTAAADMIKVSLEAAERLRTQQLEAVTGALAVHAQAIAEIAGAKGFDELAAVQAKLAGAQCQTAIDHWNCLYQSVGENQVEVARRLQEQMAQIREIFQQALVASPGGAEPMMRVLQSLVDATSFANAGIRQSAGPAERKSA